MPMADLDAGKILSLLFSTASSVGVVLVLTSVGIFLARIGVIKEAGKKTLSEISMKATIPALLFTRLLDCDQCGKSGKDPDTIEGCMRCQPLATLLQESWILLVMPAVVVVVGVVLGTAVVKVTRCPRDFDRACIAAVAFGNSTGLPIIILTVLYDSIKQRNPEQMANPLAYLPCYLIVYPLLQWSIGSRLFGVGAGEAKAPAVVLPAPTTRNAPVGAAPPRPPQPAPAAEDPGEVEMPRSSSSLLPAWGADAASASFRSAGSWHSAAPADAASSRGLAAAAARDRACSGERPQQPGQQPQQQLQVPPRRGQACAQAARQMLQPPVIAILVGLAIGLCPYPQPYGLRQLLVDVASQDGDASLQFIFKGLYQLGDAAVPINLVILGATLADGGALGELSLKTNFLIVIAKMVLMPIIVFMLVSVLRQFLLSDTPQKVSNAIWFVVLACSCTPTANNINVLAQLGKQNTKALAATIFLQYLCAPVLLTVSLAFFLATTPGASSSSGGDGPMPPGNLTDSPASTPPGNLTAAAVQAAHAFTMLLA